MAKKNKIKLPKQVAGVKIPREWRKGGEALIARAASPEGQAAIAKGLTVAAGFATMAAERTRRAHAPTPPEGATGTVPPLPPVEPAKLGQAAQIVVEAVLGRLFGGRKG